MAEAHAVCGLADLVEGQSRGFRIAERSLFLVKRHGSVYAYLNQCPHLGIELEWLPNQFLDAEGHYIQCSTHGALFTIEDGHCIAGPCQGDALQALAVEVSAEGQVFIRF